MTFIAHHLFLITLMRRLLIVLHCFYSVILQDFFILSIFLLFLRFFLILSLCLWSFSVLPSCFHSPVNSLFCNIAVLFLKGEMWINFDFKHETPTFQLVRFLMLHPHPSRRTVKQSSWHPGESGRLLPRLHLCIILKKHNQLLSNSW